MSVDCEDASIANGITGVGAQPMSWRSLDHDSPSTQSRQYCLAADTVVTAPMDSARFALNSERARTGQPSIVQGSAWPATMARAPVS
ncbi:hypothetical protein C7S18_02440 [Ahniella affigens]|uniref:Uncharacterized protein n=1 Tax=Ahniella affigens TaxID=2021234 RepID=A0A2P1PMR0_9GAMM|nr:hypothetical protein C7S18_02440 [Ahniella affigens]